MSYYIIGNDIQGRIGYTAFGRCATLEAIPILLSSIKADSLLEGDENKPLAILDSESRVLSIKTIKEIKELRGV